MTVNFSLHMLKIFNDLEPFFKDNYRRINVREYARIQNISPPSASKLLGQFEEEKLLKKEPEKNYIYYFANKESKTLINLSRIYWQTKIEESGLVGHLQKELANPLIVLFGSFSKAEITQNSDVDLAVFTVSEKNLYLENFERKVSRKIQVFKFKNMKDVENKDLLNNILNGFVICGRW